MFRLTLLLFLFSLIIFFPISETISQAQEEIAIDVALIPPTPGETPDETLDKCLEWYLEKLPLPRKYVFWECNEVVGYHGILTFTAVEGMEGYEPGVEYRVEGYEGEMTDNTMTMGQYDLNAIYARQPGDYSLFIEGYERCVEPVLDIYSEKNAIDVDETTKLILHLSCDTQPMLNRVIKIEVGSGPGELNLQELDSTQYNNLGSYQSFADKIVLTDRENGKAEAELTATGSGVIEIRATYYACSNRINQGEVTQMLQVRAGKWISIDCTYSSDSERFGDDGLRWGGSIHADVCLETFEEEVYGYTVTRLGGQATGAQECWVEPGPDEWIENIYCPDFTAVVNSGMVWPDVYTFSLDVPDSAALTFDIVYNEGDSRLSSQEWDPVVAMETAISLGFAPDSVFSFTDTTILGTRYEISARWL